jgi:hypothetical protein
MYTVITKILGLRCIVFHNGRYFLKQFNGFFNYLYNGRGGKFIEI